MPRDPRKYVVGGVRVPSVTEILSLSGWTRKYGDIDPETLVAAQIRGTRVHDLTEKYDEGLSTPSTVDERYQGYLWAWERFIEATRPKIIHSERIVISQEHRFGGTLDRFLIPTIGELAGQNLMLDIKTPAEPGEDTWGIQTAGYTIAFMEQYGDYDIERYTIRLSLTGKYELDRWPHPGDFDLFLGAAALVNAQLHAGVVTLPGHLEAV